MQPFKVIHYLTHITIKGINTPTASIADFIIPRKLFSPLKPLITSPAVPITPAIGNADYYIISIFYYFSKQNTLRKTQKGFKINSQI